VKRVPIEKTVALPEGKAVGCRWSYPEDVRVHDSRSPIVFLIPEFYLHDISRDGAGFLRATNFAELSTELNRCGLITFEFDASQSLHPQEIAELYRQGLENDAVDPDRAVLLALGQSADLLARSYYDFFTVHPPRGLILISPRVGPLELNNVTCPYLMLHSQLDSKRTGHDVNAMKEATQRHQMRYGDPTTYLVLPQISGQGSEVLAQDALREVCGWLDLAVFDEGFAHRFRGTGTEPMHI